MGEMTMINAPIGPDPVADAKVSDDERRQRYFDGVSNMVDRHRKRALEYEKEAIAYSNSAMNALTYLNGGGLLAMPTAVALFHADIERVRYSLVMGAACFIVGLLLVVGAQGCAFFTMARRSEAETFLSLQQTLLLGSTFYPDKMKPDETSIAAAKQQENSNAQFAKSDWYRRAGLGLFWASLVAFVMACLFGSNAILAR
jgi:hypothetical protein